MVEWGVAWVGSPRDFDQDALRASRGFRTFQRSKYVDLATGEESEPPGYGISFPTRKKKFVAELVFLELRSFLSGNPHYARRLEEVRKVYEEMEPWLLDDEEGDGGGSGVVLGPKPTPRKPGDATSWPPPPGH